MIIGQSFTFGPSLPPVTGLVGWLDASNFASLTLSGSTVNAIADLSGQGNDLTGGDGSFKTPPSYSATGLNSRPSILFAGSGFGNSLNRTNFSFGTSSALTIFFVGQFTNSSANFAQALTYLATGQSNYSNNLSWTIPRNGTTTGILTGRNGAAVASATFGTYGTPHRFIAVMKTDGTHTIYIDGVAGTPGSAAASTNFGTSGTLMIGNIAVGGVSPWDGAFSEVGVCNADNTSQVSALDSYLQTKWGL